MLQQERLLRVVTHQELVHFKPVVPQEAHPYQECNRSAAAQPRGLRIQVQDPPGIQILRQFPVTHHPQRFRRQVIRAGEFFRRPVYREVPAVRGRLPRGPRGPARPADGTELVPQVHFVSSLSRRIAVRFPSADNICDGFVKPAFHKRFEIIRGRFFRHAV